MSDGVLVLGECESAVDLSELSVGNYFIDLVGQDILQTEKTKIVH